MLHVVQILFSDHGDQVSVIDTKYLEMYIIYVDSVLQILLWLFQADCGRFEEATSWCDRHWV